MGATSETNEYVNAGDNGLRSFSLHTGDEAMGPLLATPEAGAELEGAGAPAANLDPETVARHYLTEALASDDLPAFALEPEVAGDTDFKPLGTETVLLTGTTAVKFRQFVHKIPIYGSLATVELDENNELLAINTSTGEPIDVDPVATISPAQALEIARGQAGDVEQPADLQPRLFYYYDQVASRWRLVYIIEDVLTAPPEGEGDISTLPEVFDYVIDAHDGALVAQLPRTQTMAAVDVTATDGIGGTRQIRVFDDGQGRRILHDPRYNVWTHDFNFADARALPHLLPGDSVANPPDPWNPSAVSAHANAVAVAAFIKDVLLRNGLDNTGGPYVSSINCVYGVAPGTEEWRNAAWLPGVGQMIYGQRRVNGALRSYAVAGDVVAHEILHGLTDATARLEYRAMSGALNESYSDIFGIIVSNLGQPDIGHWNWELGEELDGTGLPLRNLADPTLHDQPDHMNGYRNLPVTRAGDWGGVHINSGIHNKAAHNLLTSRDDAGQFMFDATSVAAIFYIALTQFLSRTSGFSDSRRGVTLAAGTFFRNLPDRDARLTAIGRAFNAVGIV